MAETRVLMFRVRQPDGTFRSEARTFRASESPPPSQSTAESTASKGTGPGPGTALHAALMRLGTAVRPGCKCHGHIREMNAKGLE